MILFLLVQFQFILISFPFYFREIDAADSLPAAEKQMETTIWSTIRHLVTDDEKTWKPYLELMRAAKADCLAGKITTEEFQVQVAKIVKRAGDVNSGADLDFEAMFEVQTVAFYVCLLGDVLNADFLCVMSRA